MEHNWQHRATSFARRHNLIHDPTTHTLDLVAEVGEVAKEILLTTDYGRQPPRLSSQVMNKLENELGDVLYSLLVLAEACSIDAGEALDVALEKYENRLAARGKVGSGRDDK